MATLTTTQLSAKVALLTVQLKTAKATIKSNGAKTHHSLNSAQLTYLVCSSTKHAGSTNKQLATAVAVLTARYKNKPLQGINTANVSWCKSIINVCNKTTYSKLYFKNLNCLK